MKKTKIEWCDSTWNPVTGCLHGCEYCYARSIARRFSGRAVLAPAGEEKVSSKLHELDKRVKNARGRALPYLYGFEPTLHRYLLEQPFLWKKPRNIFVCSMADLFAPWVPDSWLDAVFEACEAAPWHRYIFLTKYPERYAKNSGGYGVPIDGEKYWYGVTLADLPDDEDKPLSTDYLPAFTKNTFVSFEPLHFDVANQAGEALRYPSWIIIGAETGNRKNKIVPEKEWVDGIVAEARRHGKPVYMKKSLAPIVGEANMLREFPFEEEPRC